MTETEKMSAGKIYDASDSHLADRRIVAHRLSKQYNDTFEDEAEKRTAILKELIPNLGEDTYLQGPIQFDYGLYTTFGTRCYANFNFVVLDTRLRLETMSFLGQTAPWQRHCIHTYRRNATFEKKRTARFTPWNMVHRFTSGMTAGLPQMSRSAVVLPSEQAASLVQAAW